MSALASMLHSRRHRCETWRLSFFGRRFAYYWGYFMKIELNRLVVVALLIAATGSAAFAGTQTDNGAVPQVISKPTTPASVTLNYTIDTSTTATQTGRINRDGVASTCATPKAFNQFDSNPYLYVTSAPLYNQSASPVCATINVSVDATCDANVQPVAYLGSFDAANIGTNYLGDAGLSTGVPPNPVTFEVSVPANASIVVNLNAVSAPTVPCTITVSSPQLFAAAVAAPVIPAPLLSLRNLAIFGAGLLALGLIVIKRRTA
jgi:hypothetical protein